MSDLEDYESDIEAPDDESDKEEKSKKVSATKKLTQSKLKSDVQDSSGEEDLEEYDVEEVEDDIESDALEEEEEEDNSVIKNPNDMISNALSPINSDVESDEEDDLQKFDQENTLEYINKYHPECLVANSDEVEALSKVVRVNGKIVDSNHKTNPILSKYEKTKILGQRTKQLNSGCMPYIEVPNNIIDSYLIAQMELKAKKIPVIIRRPVSNSKSEYWKLADLEQIY